LATGDVAHGESRLCKLFRRDALNKLTVHSSIILYLSEFRHQNGSWTFHRDEDCPPEGSCRRCMIHKNQICLTWTVGNDDTFYG
jgi:hypothetical protein